MSGRDCAHFRPCINEKTCACEYHVQKIGNLKEEEEEDGREHLLPRVSSLGISPVAGLLALLSSFPNLFVIPAEGYLRVGGGRAAASGDAVSSLRGLFTSE